MNTQDTNALHPIIATGLSKLADETKGQGTLLCATVQKVGTYRGRAGNRVCYDDDKVQVLIWTGFRYRALIERSQKMLKRQLNQGGYIGAITRATLDLHEDTTVRDACEAIQEIQDWFRTILASEDTPNQTTGSPHWRPLEVGGVLIPGCKIYHNADRFEHQPANGTIYVSGVKLGQRVIRPAPNGPWRPNSKPKTLAKNIIKGKLPVGLFCRYKLDPERTTDLAVSKAAEQVAQSGDVPVDLAALRSLFKIAP